MKGQSKKKGILMAERCAMPRKNALATEGERFDLEKGFYAIAENFSSDKIRFVLYYENGDYAGNVSIVLHKHNPAIFHIGTMVIADERKGIGKIFFDFLVNLATCRTEAKKIITYAGNPRSLNACIKYGFKVDRFDYKEGYDGPVGGMVSYDIER